jgi:RNA recognition motif-containing protein
MQQQQESDMQQVARHSNLYVANLPASIDTEPALRNLFSAYGQIESCRLVRNSRGDGKGSFAFVKFSGINEALAAIAALNNAQVGSSVLEVKVADADAGEPRLSGLIISSVYVPF